MLVGSGLSHSRRAFPVPLKVAGDSGAALLSYTVRGGASRCATAAASARLETSSFLRMCVTWTLAVLTLIVSSEAISRFV